MAFFLTLGQGISLLVLGFTVVMGWSILILAALNTLALVLPVPGSVVSPGRALVTGIFAAIVSYPLAAGIVVIAGGYTVVRLKLTDWL